MRWESTVKQQAEKVHAEKWSRAKLMKQDKLTAEILRIGLKDHEARKLEKKEAELLKRLRETHFK